MNYETIAKQAVNAAQAIDGIEEFTNEAIRTIEGLVEVMNRMSPSSIAMLRKKYPMVDQIMRERNG